MKIEKVEKYDVGYSRTDLLKKASAAVAAALLMCGGLASCGNTEYVGDDEYASDEHYGGETYVPSEVSSDDEEFTWSGDEIYVPTESED